MAVDQSPRAVVADDPHFMRSVISDVLEDGGVDVVVLTKNGREGVSSVREHEPDVVTKDVEIPGMNGFEATDRIMTEHPTPILILSAQTDEDADVTHEALENGAVDLFRKPGGEALIAAGEDDGMLVRIRESERQVALHCDEVNSQEEVVVKPLDEILILCRNLLIYLDMDYKVPIFERITGSLTGTGYLMIGMTETLPSEFRNRYDPVAKEHRLYRRI